MFFLKMKCDWIRLHQILPLAVEPVDNSCRIPVGPAP